MTDRGSLCTLNNPGRKYNAFILDHWGKRCAVTREQRPREDKIGKAPVADMGRLESEFVLRSHCMER